MGGLQLFPYEAERRKSIRDFSVKNFFIFTEKKVQSDLGLMYRPLQVVAAVVFPIRKNV